jgi:hypothetical protein
MLNTQAHVLAVTVAPGVTGIAPDDAPVPSNE